MRIEGFGVEVKVWFWDPFGLQVLVLQGPM